MKKYMIPDIELVAFDIMDIITASGDRIEKSSLIPNVYDVEDSASFM